MQTERDFHTGESMTSETSAEEGEDIRSLADEEPERVLDLWERAGLPHRPRGRDAVHGLREQFARDSDLSLGAYVGRTLIGSVLATDDGRKGWINRLAVDPDYRRAGVGSRLLAEAERALAKRGKRIIAALVEDWNEESLSFFQARGYRPHDDITYLSKRDSEEA